MVKVLSKNIMGVHVN